MSMLQQEGGRSERVRPSWGQVGAVLGSLALCGYVDLVTGYEVSVFLLYMVPVALATRWMGWVAGGVLAVVADMVWIYADVASGHVYSRDWYLYVNAFNRLVCFGLAVAVIRYAMTRHRNLLRQLKALTGSVPVCTVCDRIGAQDGYWRSFDNHLAEVIGAEVHRQICPDCARRSYARAGYRYQADRVG